MQWAFFLAKSLPTFLILKEFLKEMNMLTTFEYSIVCLFLEFYHLEFLRNVVGFVWKCFATRLLKEVTYSLYFGFHLRYDRKPSGNNSLLDLLTPPSVGILRHWLLLQGLLCCLSSSLQPPIIASRACFLNLRINAPRFWSVMSWLYITIYILMNSKGVFLGLASRLNSTRLKVYLTASLVYLITS